MLGRLLRDDDVCAFVNGDPVERNETKMKVESRQVHALHGLIRKYEQLVQRRLGARCEMAIN